tara:strand:+ start:31329 stop:31862 length:534 start_codon:yes stop_codon:yes gene_type:complete
MTGHIFHYFAYGSNMLTERLTARCASARALGTGSLADHALNFSKQSNDGSAKAAPVKKPDAKLPGVLFELNGDEIPALDKLEGAGYGYERQTVSVYQDSTTSFIAAETYFATNFDTNLKPYDWYHTLVLCGAIQHGLPDWHIEYIQNNEVMVDPEPSSAGRMKAIKVLQKAGFEEFL